MRLSPKQMYTFLWPATMPTVVIAVFSAVMLAACSFITRTEASDTVVYKTVADLEKIRDDARSRRAALSEADAQKDLIAAVPAGTYFMDRPLVLTAADSGTSQSRTIFQGQGSVRLLAGKIVQQWQPVSDPAVRAQLPEACRDKVMETRLADLGIDKANFGSPASGGLELFYGGQPMTLARYPNDGFVKIVNLTESESQNIRGTKGSTTGKFYYDDEHCSRWTNEKAPWVHGYWFWDWAEQKHPIESIDTATKLLSVKPPYHNYGYRKGQWFYGFNLLCELDSPGEYYLDRETGVLYFLPPEGVTESSDSSADITTTESFVTVGSSILTVQDASFVSVDRMTLEGGRQTMAVVRNSTSVDLTNLTLCNGGDSGISVSGGKNNRVYNCELFGLGANGISLSGGDRTSLTPCNHVADNNYVHHYARTKRVYNPGITVSGVGCVIRHNLITDAPHMGIGFGGNDHVMEYNEIARVCWESNDAGAVYTGRNWTSRGNIFRYNYLHDIEGFQKKGCVGVYLDDMFSSCAIEGNVFLRVTRAAMIGGGRDNTIINNIFVDCRPSLHVDARALGWCADHANGWLNEAQTKGTISGIAFDKPPYSTRYPALAAILSGEPKAPEGNVISKNICYGGVWDKPAGFWRMSIEGKARPYLTMEGNTTWTEVASQNKSDQPQTTQFEGENPLFVNPDEPEKANFKLQDDSPAYKNGYQPVPFEKMGRK